MKFGFFSTFCRFIFASCFFVNFIDKKYTFTPEYHSKKTILNLYCPKLFFTMMIRLEITKQNMDKKNAGITLR